MDIHILADRNLAALHTENHPLCFHWRFHRGPQCHPSTVHPLEGKASVLLCRRGAVIQSVSLLAEIQRRVSVFQITLVSEKRDCWKGKEICLKFTFCFLLFHWFWFISLLCKFNFFPTKAYFPLNIDFSWKVILIQTLRRKQETCESHHTFLKRTQNSLKYP